MNRKKLSGLIVLNVALLATLLLFNLLPQPQASAQITERRAGDYIMLAAPTYGRSDYDTIYITDINNSVIVALHCARNEFIVDGYRNIIRDAQARKNR